MLITAINMKILNVMQICDSNFPVGSFNHSFGMETYLRDGDIKDSKTLKIWLLYSILDISLYIMMVLP